MRRYSLFSACGARKHRGLSKLVWPQGASRCKGCAALCLRHRKRRTYAAMRRTGWTGLAGRARTAAFRGKGLRGGGTAAFQNQKGRIEDAFVTKYRRPAPCGRMVAGGAGRAAGRHPPVGVKWESGQSVPDAERLVKLSELFGVSVDFLLKGDGPPAGDALLRASAARLVTAGEAADYLALRGRAAGRIAAGTMPVHPVAGLPAAARGRERRRGGALSETAARYGLAALLVLVAGAVALFIHCGLQSAPYRYLDEPFTLEQAAAELVRGRLEADKRAYGRKCVAGGVLCVLAALPLLLTAILTGGDALAVVASLCGTLLLAGAGSALFILAGVPRAAAERLFADRRVHARGQAEGARCWRCFPRCTGLRRRPFICC